MLLCDFLETEVDERYYLSEKMIDCAFRTPDTKHDRIDFDRYLDRPMSFTLTQTMVKMHRAVSDTYVKELYARDKVPIWSI